MPGRYERLRKAYSTFRQYQRFTDSPTDRVKGLSVSLLTDKTLPNVVLGAAITASLQYLVGSVNQVFLGLTWVAWVYSVILYALGNEFLHVLKAARDENPIDPEDERTYR